MTLLGRSNDGSTGRPGVFHSPRQEHTAAYWDHNAAYTGEYWHDDIPRDDAIAQGDPAYSGHTDPSFASYSDNPLTAATTPPNFRTRLSGTRRNNHPANSSTHRATYWAQGRPVLKEEKWNNITAMLPTLPPRTEKKEIKHVCLKQLGSRISSARGNHTDKKELLISKVEHLHPAAKVEAELVTAEFNTYSSNIYEYTAVECYDAMYEYIALGTHNNFTPEERTHIKWFKVAMQITPRFINTGSLQVEANLFQEQTTLSIFIQAPSNENGSLIAEITKANSVINPTLLQGIYSLGNHPWVPRMKKSHQDAVADAETFQHKLKNIRDKTEFYAILQLVEASYVGERSGLESVNQRLLKINHRHYNPVTRDWEWRSVADVILAFQIVIQDIDINNPPANLPNLEATFVQAMSATIKKKLFDSMQNNANPNLTQNLADFHRITQEALKHEDEFRSLNRMAEQAAGRVAGRASRLPRSAMPAKTFLTTNVPNENQEFMMALMDQAAETAEEQAQAYTFAGVSRDVEQALRQASGVRVPIKCFGCDGIMPESQCYHLWRDCPNKHKKDIWLNFQQNLKKFRDRKEQDRKARTTSYGPSNASNWRREGYANRRIKEHIEAIANPTTAPEIRKTLLGTLALELHEPEDQEEDASVLEDATPVEPPRKRSRSKTPGMKGRTRGTHNFLLFMKTDHKTKQAQEEVKAITSRGDGKLPKTLFGGANKRRYDFNIAFQLPHIVFPIGDGSTEKDKGTFTFLMDTGGCCMMGNLNYFEELHKQCPQFFVDLWRLEDERYEDICIGGLKDGIWLTHMAILKLPYDDKGEQVTLEVGLSSELPVDGLMGVRFQQQIKLAIDLGSNTATSPYLQETYKLEWRTPQNKPLEHIRLAKGTDAKAFYNDQDE